MRTLCNYHTQQLQQAINGSHETKTQLYLEQILCFPDNIQDKIIDDISRLSQCNSDSIASIIYHYNKSRKE